MKMDAELNRLRILHGTILADQWGITTKDISLVRTPQEQARLFRKGAKGGVMSAKLSKLKASHNLLDVVSALVYDEVGPQPTELPPVTNAGPFQSPHVWGLAYDKVPFINGKPVWDRDDLWEKIGAVGGTLGLVWGGNWRGIVDKPHFEMPNWKLHAANKLFNLINGEPHA